MESFMESQPPPSFLILLSSSKRKVTVSVTHSQLREGLGDREVQREREMGDGRQMKGEEGSKPHDQ